MLDEHFSRENMKKEIAQANLNAEVDANGSKNKGIIKRILKHHQKIIILQYIVSIVMIIFGIILSCITEGGIGITIGSLVQGDTEISNITVNFGALLILCGFIILINVIKNSDINFKEK